MSAHLLDGLTWLIVVVAALYVARSIWARVQAARPQPNAAAGTPGPMGSTLAPPGSGTAGGCSGCSGSCGSGKSC